MLESLFNKVAGLLQHMCFLVNIAKFFDSKSPVASVDLLFLIKSNVGWFLLKRVDLVIVRVIYTLLVETISTRFYWLTCRNHIYPWNAYRGRNHAETPIRHIIFWKTVIKNFRSIYVNCFNTCRFLAEVSTKLQKMHLYGQFKDHNSGRKHGN